MSWRHSRAVGELPLKRPPLKAVLLALAHHADEYTGECFPSIARLVLFTGLSERSVQQALAEAEQAKLLARKHGRGKTTTLYTLTLPGMAVVEQGARPAPGGARPAPGGAGAAPKQSENSQRKTLAREQTEVPEDWWPSAEAIARVKKEHPHVDVEHETRQFIEYNRARATLFANHGAAWRSWINRAGTHPGQRRARSVDREGADYLSSLASGPVSGRQH